MALILSACGKDYDDQISEVNKRIDNVENRLTSLETWQKNANDEVTTLKTLTNTLVGRNYIVSVDETDNGYRITFGDGMVASIYNGADGTDAAQGQKPVISIVQGSDGNYYWTVNGELLKDANGNPVRANGIDGKDGADGKDGKDGADGKDGVTPMIRINPTTYNWEVSLDNGNTWSEMTDANGNPFSAKGADGKDGVDGKDGKDGIDGKDGKNGVDGKDGKDGDSFFKGAPVIDQTAGTVTFTLTDGTQIVAPYYDNFKAVRDRLQSLVYIPDYSDGKMTIPDGNGTVSLRYAVRPAAIAAYMANHADQLSLSVLNGLVTTRAASASLSITGVKSAVSDGTGIFTLTVASSGFSASDGYAVALSFSDGTSDYMTGYTPVWVKMSNPTASIKAADGTAAGSTVAAGKGIQLLAEIMTGDAVKSWTTDNKNVAAIDSQGWLALISQGTVTVTLTTVQGATATFSLNVSAGAVSASEEGVDQNKAEIRRK